MLSRNCRSRKLQFPQQSKLKFATCGNCSFLHNPEVIFFCSFLVSRNCRQAKLQICRLLRDREEDEEGSMSPPARGSGAAHESAAARSTTDTPKPRKRPAISSDQGDDETTPAPVAPKPRRQRLIDKLFEKAHNDVVNGLAPEYVPENTPERYLEAVQQYNQVTRPLLA